MSEGVRLYAGTQAGLIIWRSGNNGWQEVGRHFEDGIIDSIFGCTSAPERVFVGVTHYGLYRTIDGGKSWSKILRGDIRSVTVDPTDDKVIYSGLEPVELYRSEDGGDHWEEMAALQEVPETARKNWWFPQPPHQGTLAISSSIPTTRASSICASNMAVSCAASTVVRAGRMSARASII